MTIERTRDRYASDERAPVRVQPYAGEKPDWDACGRGSAGGTFFHLIGWKEVLERTFALRSHYLVARRGDAIVGVLPLFELRSPFMERCLLSLPFAVEGGVACDAPPARQALDAAAVDLKAKGVKFTMEPRPFRNLKIAFIEGPDGVSIELVQPAAE